MSADFTAKGNLVFCLSQFMKATANLMTTPDLLSILSQMFDRLN